MRKIVLKGSLFFALILVSAILPLAANAALTDGLVSYWTLDDTLGDSTVTGNTLINNGSTPFATGKINNAADLNGSSQWLSKADNASLSITGDLSISAWINLDTDPSGNIYSIATKYRPADSNASFLFSVGEGNHLEMRISSDCSAATDKFVSFSPATDGSTWYNVAVVYDASEGAVYFYVDGSQQGDVQTSYPTSICDSAASFFIGAYGNPTQYYNGKIDEVGVWNRVLTSTEIADIYNGGEGLPYPLTPPEEPPVGGGGSYRDMLASSTDTFAATTGFDVWALLDWGGENLIKVGVGSLLGAIYELRYWLAAGAVIAACFWFVARAAFTAWFIK